jgi:hypothetical protein
MNEVSDDSPNDKHPTRSNGQVCYIEIPAIDVKASADFYRELSVGGSDSAATATSPLTIQ